MFGGPQKDTKVMTGSQSVVPEEPYHRAAQHGRVGYRLSPRGQLDKGYAYGRGNGGDFQRHLRAFLH